MSGPKAYRPPRGMRDLLPPLQRRFLYVTDTLRGVFETFGFEPLATPSAERAETLFGKYGPDAERLIYRAGHGRELDLALRYDLTVPLARVCAGYEDLPRPFKRYQIGSVWRGERPQRGRFREFLQADADIVGTESLLADAEIIALVATALDRLRFPRYTIKLNNRRLLTSIGRYAGVPEPVLPGLYRAIDKLDKIGPEGVRLELRAVGLPAELVNRQRQAVGRWLRGQADRARLERDLGESPPPELARALATYFDALASYPPGSAAADSDEAEAARLAATNAVMAESIAALRGACPAAGQIPDAVTDRLMALLALRGEGRALLADLARHLDDEEGRAGLAELGALLDGLDAAGLRAGYELDFAMVRGLEYYTGTIFETLVPEPPIGTILSGGRYDKLIGLFGRGQPAVGASFGVDRLVDVLDTLGLFPPDLDQATGQLLVAPLDAAARLPAAALAARLRRAGIATELGFEEARPGDQIRLALQRGYPLVALLGPDELAAGTVSLRLLASRSQVSVPDAELVDRVRILLRGANEAARAAEPSPPHGAG